MLATHLIFGAYGFWLPNDPRGSWSDFVGSCELYRFGRATKTTETRSLASRPHDRDLRLGAKSALNRPPVKFTGIQARAVGRGFANYAHTGELVCFACSILPDHVHLVVAEHRLAPDQILTQLKGAATEQLVAEQIHPFQQVGRPPKCFARGGWKVYLDTTADVLRAIEYVENNPMKAGLPRQHWSFVTPFPSQS